MSRRPPNILASLRRTAVAVLLVLLVLLIAEVATACPTCAQGMADDEAGQRLVNGYFWSILFMMAMPFTLLGGFSGYMYLEVRRTRTDQRALGESSDGKDIRD